METHRMLAVYCVLCMLVGLILVGTVSRTTLWCREREQKRRREEATAAAAGLDDPLPPPAKWKHRQHKVHECQYCHQALSCKY